MIILSREGSGGGGDKGGVGVGSSSSISVKIDIPVSCGQSTWNYHENNICPGNFFAGGGGASDV